MMYRAVVDASGRIERVYGALFVEALDMNAPPGPLVHDAPGPVRPDTHWWNGTAWADRPVPPAPPALTAGVAVFWTGLPPGAEVTVDPLNGAAPVTEIVNGTGTLEIGLDVGPWRISVSEVFPAVAASWLIEVAA